MIKRKYLPYQDEYKALKLFRKIGNYFLYIIGFLSILIPILNHNTTNFKTLIKILEYINLILIILLYTIDIVANTFLQPSVSRYRQINFLDNSLGTKLLGDKSTNYFDNENIKYGIYKLLVNNFENCFFTYSIAKEMRFSLVLKNVIFSILLITTAYFGFINSSISLPAVQIILSSLFVTELIHHLNFVSKLKSLLEKYKEIFTQLYEKPYLKNDIKDPIRLLMEYETILSYNKSELSDKVYEKLREQLTNKWLKMKKFYNI